MNNIKTLRSFLRCVSFCTADSYDILAIATYFRKKGYFTRLSRDSLHVSNLKRSGDVFFFNHGCFVCWGYKKNFEDKLLEIVKDFSVHPLNNIETDYFSYRYGEETNIDTHERLRLDIFTLESQDPQIKLAISYGLAQSIKLEAFEEAIQVAIKKNSYLPEEIATKGIISLSRRAIFKRIGEIFIARSSININIEFLDTPEFFLAKSQLRTFLHYE